MDSVNPTDEQKQPSTDTPEQVNEVEVAESTTPDPEPAQPEPPTVVESKPQNAAITLVLQWLTYASWLWFSGAMLWLVGAVLAYFILGSESTSSLEVIAYPVAAVIVLLIVSSVIDFFYAHREPEHKEGFATVIMVIHAVIFVLCAIGSLIVAVFAAINLLIESSVTTLAGKTALVGLLVGLVGLLLYVVLAVRTTMIAKIRRLSLIVVVLMTIVGIGFVIASFVGPVAHAIVAKQDQQLESTLPNISYAVNEYVQSNEKLPTSLNEVKFSTNYQSYDEEKLVIAKNLVKYTPNTQPPQKQKDGYTIEGDVPAKNTSSYYPIGTASTVYYYRLCVTWKSEKKSSYDTYPAYADDTAGSGSKSGASVDSTYLNTSSHKKGEQCYDLQAIVY